MKKHLSAVSLLLLRQSLRVRRRDEAEQRGEESVHCRHGVTPGLVASDRGVASMSRRG
jgi:hypothetical protein